jgi:hypothetical protein
VAPFTLGLSVTSPGLHLAGGGTVAVDTAITGFDLDGDGVANPVFTADHQRDIQAHYRSPLSVGLGAGYRVGGTELHASAEWFDRVARYRVLDITPFTSQSSGVRTDSPIVDEAKSVLDLGVGLAQRFGEHLSGFGGFSLDRTPRVPGTALSVGAWDIYHVSSGAEFRLGRTDLILGMVYSFGQEDVRELAEPGAGSGAGLGQGPACAWSSASTTAPRAKGGILGRVARPGPDVGNGRRPRVRGSVSAGRSRDCEPQPVQSAERTDARPGPTHRG